jgi:ParB family transcriptional regulator, chromosome partitioning protein
MKAASDLRTRLGAHMRESMGHPDPTPESAPAVAVIPGESKYKNLLRVKEALKIPLDRLDPDPNQPRREFDAASLAELAASMKARGQLQAIRVRWEESACRWIIVAGERRYRAAMLAGLPTLMCVEAIGPLTPDDALEDQLVENCLREDLRPIEQARAFKALIDRRAWTQRQLAATLHIAQASVAKALALLDLPEDLQAEVDAGTVPATAAYEVAKVKDDDIRRDLVGKIAAGTLSRDQAQAEVRRVTGGSARTKGRGTTKGKPRKITDRAFRLPSGYKFTVEYRKGITPEGLLTAWEALGAMIRAELPADAAADQSVASDAA